jgi:type II secretory pathway pseudopilin PulG
MMLNMKVATSFPIAIIIIIIVVVCLQVSNQINGDQTCLETESDGTYRQCLDGAQQQQQQQQQLVSQSSPSLRWDPGGNHRCNIQRVTVDQLYATFGKDGLPPLYHSPIIILANTTRNVEFRKRTSLEQIVQSLPMGFHVTLSSSNSFSEHRRTVPLTQYLQEIQQVEETTPEMLANETWYLFGETFSNEWKELLSHYELPICHTCTRDLTALSFGIGNRGSGVQWHIHGPGFSEALHGKKHWILYPPKEKPPFHPDHTSRYWMEHVYTKLPVKDLPHECTLEPGDMIYFPDRWWHATINLDPYTSFISSFTTERSVTVAGLFG